MSANDENKAAQSLAEESEKTVELSRKFHDAISKSAPPPKAGRGAKIVPLPTPAPFPSPFAPPAKK